MAGSLLALFVAAEVASAGLALPPPSSLQLVTTVAWDASPSPEVTGYAVYYQVANLPITNRVDVGKALSVTLPLLVGAVHSIYAVAYTGDGIESEPSNVLNYTPPPITRLKLSKLPDGSMQLRFRTSPLALCWVEWTEDLAAAAWQVWTAVGADVNGDIILTDSTAGGTPSRFYRAAKF